MSARRRRLVLAVVATDRTLERVERRGESMWLGKCLFCNAKIAVGLDGEILGRATIEHIRPRNHGTDDPENLALACDRCNHEKGRRHDHRDPSDAEAVDHDPARRATPGAGALI